MHRIKKHAVLAAGSAALALAFYLLLALPGVLSDQASTVPLRETHEMRP